MFRQCTLYHIRTDSYKGEVDLRTVLLHRINTTHFDVKFSKNNEVIIHKTYSYIALVLSYGNPTLRVILIIVINQ